MPRRATIQTTEYEVNLSSGESIVQGGMTITAHKRTKLWIAIPAMAAAYQIDKSGQVVRKFESVGRKAVEAAETG